MQSTWEVLPYIRLLPYMKTATMNKSLQCFRNTSIHVNTSDDIPECFSTMSQNCKFPLTDEIRLHPCFNTLLHWIKNVASFTENQNYFSLQKFEQLFVHGLHKPSKKKYTYGTFCIYLSIRWVISVGQKTDLTFSSSAVLHLRPKTWHKLLLHWLTICSFQFPMNYWLGKSLLPMWGSNSH